LYKVTGATNTMTKRTRLAKSGARTWRKKSYLWVLKGKVLRKRERARVDTPEEITGGSEGKKSATLPASNKWGEKRGGRMRCGNREKQDHWTKKSQNKEKKGTPPAETQVLQNHQRI